MFVRSTRECLLCGHKVHQIDGTEERASAITAAAMERHMAAEHADRTPAPDSGQR